MAGARSTSETARSEVVLFLTLIALAILIAVVGGKSGRQMLKGVGCLMIGIPLLAISACIGI